MTKIKFAVTLLFLFLFSILVQPTPTAAQKDFDPKIPSPQSVIGHEVGEQFTHFFQAEQYYKAMAQSSVRVKLVKYGETNEHRALYLLLISSPENLKRIEEIQRNIQRLSDPRKTDTAAADAIIKTTPPICWLGYNVHGNESSSAEAALLVVYRLAAGNDPDTQFILDNSIVIVDPLLNPDGRERYVNFYDQMEGKHPNKDPNAAEHRELWPGGRYNHYLFDLNRDWVWQTQRETQARTRMYLQWNPQVHVDFHEMSANSSYFFPPDAAPINANIASQVLKWLKIFGTANAKAFDAKGWPYFTREDFDLFYPAYGDSWPSFHGAIGMTYEQGGGGFGGLHIKLQDKTELTLKSRVEHHVMTSMATMMTTAQNREALLRDYYLNIKGTLEEGQRGPVRAYLIPPSNDSERITALINLLRAQGIEISQATQTFTAEAVHDYFGGTPGRKEFPAGTYIIDVAQPYGRLVRALLEPEAAMKAKFFYDITAWSMPLAFGVESFYTGAPVNPPMKPVQKAEFTGGGIDAKARVAYLFEWKTNTAARLLARLLQEDIHVAVALKPFTLQGHPFDRGTLVVQVAKNPESLHEKIAAAAKEFNLTVTAMSTSLVQEGIDLGSNYVQHVRKPKIAVVTGDPVSPTEYGAVWNLFDNQYDISFTPIRVAQLRSVDLRPYNVLLFLDDLGTGRGYSQALDKSTVEKLKSWVHDGGTFIGVKGGAVFATDKRSGLSSVTYHYVLKRDEEARINEEKTAQAAAPAATPSSATTAPPAAKDEASKKQNEEKELAEKLKTWDEKEVDAQTDRIPGALMKIRLDNTHPLAFGYGKEVVVANMTSPILELTSKGDNVGYYPKDNFKVSGFITEDNLKKFPNTAYLIREDQGRGHVILYADDPNFRSFWEGTSRLFLNSIFFGAIDNPGVR